MRRTDTSRWPCNIARGANVLADLWNVLIIREACLGTRRFADFQRNLGVGRNILTTRLKGLVEQGILTREPYDSTSSRYEYRLTDKGRDAYTVLAAMATWAERWLSGPEGTPVLLHHDICDRDMRGVVVCSECATPLDVREVRARPGPGYHCATTSARCSVEPRPARSSL